MIFSRQAMPPIATVTQVLNHLDVAGFDTDHRARSAIEPSVGADLNPKPRRLRTNIAAATAARTRITIATAPEIAMVRSIPSLSRAMTPRITTTTKSTSANSPNGLLLASRMILGQESLDWPGGRISFSGDDVTNGTPVTGRDVRIRTQTLLNRQEMSVQGSATKQASGSGNRMQDSTRMSCYPRTSTELFICERPACRSGCY
jgi:hypothetical protein